MCVIRFFTLWCRRSSSTLICLPPLQGCCPGQGDRLSAVPGKTAYFRKCWWVSCNLQSAKWNKQVTAQKRPDETYVRRMINHLTFSYFCSAHSVSTFLTVFLLKSRSKSLVVIVLFTLPVCFVTHRYWLFIGEGEFCHDTMKENKLRTSFLFSSLNRKAVLCFPGGTWVFTKYLENGMIHWGPCIIQMSDPTPVKRKNLKCDFYYLSLPLKAQNYHVIREQLNTHYSSAKWFLLINIKIFDFKPTDCSLR